MRQIGEKLGVTSVLEGSVRKVGNRVRITAQLINVADGYHLWSETYDRQLEDVFAIQDEISHAIVDALKLRLGDEGGHAGRADQEHRGLHAVPEGAVRLQQGHRAVHPEGAGVLPAVAAPGPGLRPGLRRHRRLLDPAGGRLGGAGRRLSAGQGGGDPRAAARPRPGRGDHLAGQGAVLVRVGLRRRRAAAPPGRDAERQLRRGALGVRQRAADGGPAGRGDRGDAEGAGARPALCGVQPVARPLPAVQRRLSRRDRPGQEDDGPERRLRLLVSGHRLRVPGARRRREGAAVVPARPGARDERALLRRADRAGSGAAGAARGSRRDPGPAGGGVPAALRAIRDPGDGLCRGGRLRPGLRLPRAGLSGAVGGADLPARGSGVRAAACRSAVPSLVERIGLR